MPKYRVMCKKYGWADVEASSEEEALEKAEQMSDHGFDWSDADDHEVVERVDSE